MTTARLPLRRTEHFRDADGNLSFSKREDEILPVTIDWSPQLGSDVISTVAYEDHGVTRSSTSNTGNTTTTYVTKSGCFEITLTTTGGRTIQRIVRFFSIDGGTTPDDYRGG